MILQNFVILHTSISYTMLAILTLSIGSVANVIIYRLPIMIKIHWTKDCCQLLQLPDPNNTKPINFFFPNSHCPSCSKPIKPWFNIPLLGFLILRGRSHCCNLPISSRYPIVEFVYSALCLFSAWHFGFNLVLLYVCIFIFFCISLIFIDLEHKLLPDLLTLSLLWIGLLINTQNLFVPLTDAVIGAASGYLSLWLLIEGYALLTGKIGMGNGDFKLFAALGAWFGYSNLPTILLISSLSGAILGILYLKISKQPRDTPIPFGPFLCCAGLILLFIEVTH